MKTANFGMPKIHSENVETFYCCFLGIPIPGQHSRTSRSSALERFQTLLSLLLRCPDSFVGLPRRLSAYIRLTPWPSATAALLDQIHSGSEFGGQDMRLSCCPLTLS